ncbi:hypothetical protein OG883_45495 [Streptomyces sp. NBC_01142]|uniref:hypothetical protein n=1 Tax=Streptomyces sp. NBC_01142 TaxID=2975865 RepID=UPI00224E9447|nr:hypothetical protein [Streptomyces sp. NBC_01142]MCX4826895.1 hypothetical protein [Streptomyces sp. NBC_01142]
MGAYGVDAVAPVEGDRAAHPVRSIDVVARPAADVEERFKVYGAAFRVLPVRGRTLEDHRRGAVDQAEVPLGPDEGMADSVRHRVAEAEVGERAPQLVRYLGVELPGSPVGADAGEEHGAGSFGG